MLCAVLVSVVVNNKSPVPITTSSHHSHGHHHHKHKIHNKSEKTQATPAPSTALPPALTPHAKPTLPAQVLNLTNWKLTIPIKESGEDDAAEIEQPQLASYSSQFFHVNDTGDGVILQANAGGVTTGHSKYPRSELREMTNNGLDEASWSDKSGTHTMTVKEAITHLPVAKPQVVAGQIHDQSDDIIMIRLEGKHLFVEAGDGKNAGDLDTNYQLGKVFTVQVVASGGHIKVSYNGVPKVDYQKSGSDWYFKAGCYTQSNTDKGDSPDAYGQVVIYGLNVSHS